MSETPGGSGPLFLLDGMSLAFRAYFALPGELATEGGTVTNAVLGFSSMLVNLVRDHQPSALAVAFDLPGRTFRDEIVDDYKAGRAETPDDLLPQFDMIRAVLKGLAVPVVGVPGFEADDVLATLATAARDRGSDVVVVTGDRDCFQLVEDPHVKVLYNRRGVSDYALYDEAGILDRTGVPPFKYPMLAALRGDPSDNLAGVPGVGEKTAAKLLNTYDDLDGIFANLTALTPKLRENLAAHEKQVRANAAATPLVRNVALDVELSDIKLGGWQLAEARAVFEELEMRTLWKRMLPLLKDGLFGAPGEGSELPDLEAEGIDSSATPARNAGAGASAGGGFAVEAVSASLARPANAAEATKAIAEVVRAAGGEPLALAGHFSAAPGRSRLLGLAMVPTGSPDGVWIEGDLLETAAVRDALNKSLSSTKVVGHNVKELFRSLLPLGIDVTSLFTDTAVAAYLLDPSSGDYGLEAVTGMAAGAAHTSGQLDLLGDASVDDGQLAGDEATTVAQLVAPMHQRLEEDGLLPLHDLVEVPLVRVLARMEVTGIRVDVEELRAIADELTGDTKTLEQEIQQLAGHEFNVNSTQQLRTVLYDELGLTPGRKTKTGFSTDAATLESLRDIHPIVDTLLRYREVEKLRSTYGESLLAEVAADGRIHASFRQTVARTGRLSSDRPNLHNIPVRTEGGRRFRRAFVPAEGTRFLVADYDQIELRVIAHLSGDPGLIEAFRTGADVHRTVAAGVYGVLPEDVTKTQREFSKMVSYGLAYGMEAFGLSRRLSTSVEEASEIMDSYFGAFPNVRAYMERTVAEARSRGFTRTELGRKRPLPELSDRNFRIRQAAERQAMNAGIQGLAADLFKTALVRLEAALEGEGLQSRLVLQVHDEVILEVLAGEEDAVGALTEEALVGAASLSVPLKVSSAWGDSWAEAKGG